MTVVAAEQVHESRGIVALFGGSGEHAETLSLHVNIIQLSVRKGDGLVQKQ
jgi:hypothetical protein